MIADRFQHDINRFQELLAVQVFQYRQIDTRAAFGDFRTHPVEPFLQQQGVVDREVSIPEVILPSALIMPVASSAFAHR